MPAKVGYARVAKPQKTTGVAGTRGGGNATSAAAKSKPKKTTRGKPAVTGRANALTRGKKTGIKKGKGKAKGLYK